MRLSLPAALSFCKKSPEQDERRRSMSREKMAKRGIWKTSKG